MKKMIGAALFFYILAGCKVPSKTAVSAVTADSAITTLYTLNDSASYAIGISVANFYKQQGLPTLNSQLVSKAIDDVLGGKKVAFDDATANIVMNNYMNKLQAEKSKPTIEAGEQFLAQNKLRPGVITTSSGLQYEVIKEGGGARPNVTDSVTCHYRGTLLDGTPIDNSYDRGQPLTFFMGRIIKGWAEGVQLMTVGSKYKFYIPYTLGYGPNDYGAIPGGSVLVFEIELLHIVNN